MNDETIIGKHAKCGGDVESWYQSGHYYHYSGVFCRKCKKEFKSCDDKAIRKPKLASSDMGYVELAKR